MIECMKTAAKLPERNEEKENKKHPHDGYCSCFIRSNDVSIILEKAGGCQIAHMKSRFPAEKARKRQGQYVIVPLSAQFPRWALRNRLCLPITRSGGR